MGAKQQAYKNLADTMIKNFSKRNIEAFYCDDRSQAVSLAMEMMKDGSTVGFGGFSQFHPVFVDPADVMRGELHVAEHITVFDLVGIAQMVVHDPELFVAFVKPPVDFVNQGGVAPQPPVWNSSRAMITSRSRKTLTMTVRMRLRELML